MYTYQNNIFSHSWQTNTEVYESYIDYIYLNILTEKKKLIIFKIYYIVSVRFKFNDTEVLSHGFLGFFKYIILKITELNLISF